MFITTDEIRKCEKYTPNAVRDTVDSPYLKC